MTEDTLALQVEPRLNVHGREQVMDLTISKCISLSLFIIISKYAYHYHCLLS